MGDKTGIEWTDATWNPIVGCSPYSPGCKHCYAMPMAARIERMGAAPHYAGLTDATKAGPVFNGKVAQAPDRILTAPLRWKKPRRIFVNSMGDLFHESIPDEWIDRVFAVMALCPQHTFQVLTKRAEWMRAYVRALMHGARPIADAAMNVMQAYEAGPAVMRALSFGAPGTTATIPFKPLSNVWLGVSTERQQEADERIPYLLQTPAAVRFISAEPLLGPINLHEVIPDPLAWSVAHGFDGLDWVIVGGESGRDARPMHPDWSRSLRDQCAAGGVPFFFKQWGEFAPLDSFSEAKADAHVYRCGKKSAGRLLDGKEHNAFPDTSAKARAA